jgi:hypothetical protein
MANPQAFSGRNGYSLYFDVTQVLEPGNNRSRFDWSMYIYATNVSFKPFGLDNVQTAVATIAGTQVLNINWSYDYRSAVVNTVVTSLGSDSHYVSHDTTGYLGPQSWTSTAVAVTGPLGSATADGSSLAQDFDRSPSWSSFNIPSPTIRGNSYFGQVIANAASSYGLINGTSVPSGLTFNSNGTITGTPNTVQSRSFTFRAFGTFEGSTDSSATIEVRPRTPVFTDTSFATAIRGVSYSDAVSATEAASYSRSGTIPPGLTFNSNGTITGTPTTLGSFPFTVFATNITGTSSASVTLVVNRPTPVYTDSTVSSASTLGVAYSDGVAATDATNYAINSGSLPAGLSLNASTGAITGTPTAVGNFTFVIRASNETGGVNTSSLSINVISPVRVNTAGPNSNTATFVVGAARVWNGTSFVAGVVRVWNGTAFVSSRLT